MAQFGRRRWWVAAVAALCLGAPPGALAVSVRWIYPPPNSLITESPVPLLGVVVGPPARELRARIVSADEPGAPRSEDLFLFRGKVFSGSVELAPGRNNIVVGDSVLPVLYRPGSTADREGPFRRPRPHGGGVESCNPCHVFRRGELVLKKRLPELCLGCHQIGTESLRAVIKENEHTRTLTPDCVQCHDPHVSFEPALLRNPDDLCARCHPEQSGPTRHDGVAAQACTACHDPHASAYPDLLKGDPLDLCHSCHRDLSAPRRYPRSYHAPVEEGRCFDCHAPHSTGAPSLLRRQVPGLCRACHKAAEEGPHKGELDECRLCHEPHMADRRRLLKPGSTEVCLECHAPPPEDARSRHPALDQGCVTCHDPHRPRGLRGAERTCGPCHNLREEGFRWTHGQLPMTRVDQCTFCHEPHASAYPSLLRGRIHYPLKNGGCNACHEVRRERIELRYEGSQICTRCHGQITGTSAVVETDKVHKPVYQIDCTACHNPHLGVRDKFLLEDPVTLCGWCHGLLLRGVENVHGVFEEGTCYTCHLPHISDFRPLLKRPERQLCTSCHTEVAEIPAGLVHGALKADRCTGCHNPHGTNTEFLLKESRDELCRGCHGEVLRDGDGAPLRYLHGPVGAGNCTACHTLGHRHASAGDRFLRAEGSRVCALCHETGPDHVPVRFRAKMEEVRNDCLACHLPHGAGNRFMMRGML